MTAMQNAPPDQDEAPQTTPEDFRNWIISMGYPPARSVGYPSTRPVALRRRKDNVVCVSSPENMICPADWRYVARDLGLAKQSIYNMLKGVNHITAQTREKMDDLSLLKRVQTKRKMSKADLKYIDSRIDNLPAELALIVKLFRQRDVTPSDLEYVDARFSALKPNS